jgi:hypothetical protein
MQRLTCTAWPAIPIVADSTDVLTLRVDEEDVCAAAEPLRASFQPSPINGEKRKIHIFPDHYKKIDILWMRSIGANRSQQTDALDARHLSRGSNELGCESEQTRSTITWA